MQTKNVYRHYALSAALVASTQRRNEILALGVREEEEEFSFVPNSSSSDDEFVWEDRSKSPEELASGRSSARWRSSCVRSCPHEGTVSVAAESSSQGPLVLEEQLQGKPNILLSYGDEFKSLNSLSLGPRIGSKMHRFIWGHLHRIPAPPQLGAAAVRLVPEICWGAWKRPSKRPERLWVDKTVTRTTPMSVSGTPISMGVKHRPIVERRGAGENS